MDKRTSFAQLVAHKEQIRIPTIQRDYAQGRKDHKDVRNEFLGAIREALLRDPNDPALPLDLDFVYGSHVDRAFQPLDGQQRLTTLFLLHWFLASNDGELADFRARFVEGRKSRFGYKVRPGSEEFIDALSTFERGPISGPISEVIKDQPWYKRSWQFDQTIRSSLGMLDAMQAQFTGAVGLYRRLIDENNPAITFQLLDLGQFNLSDELYIKMNARGKPLTAFETFKARFEQHLRTYFGDLKLPICDGLPIDKFFAQRMDQQWSDFFWPYREPVSATFDDAIMNVMRVVILVTRDPESADTESDLADLRGDFPSTFTAFNNKKWLDKKFVVALLSLLETWSQPNPKLSAQPPVEHAFDLPNIANRIMNDPSRLTFQELAMFAGYVQFIAKAQGHVDADALAEWMRVVFNLAVNTVYNRPEDLRRSFTGLVAVTSRMSDVITYLAEPSGDVAGFSRPQVAEERLKAHLIRLDDGWSERIRRAEQHNYFKGQIGFLLRFAGFDLDEIEGDHGNLDVPAAKTKIGAFEHYLACADQMVSDLFAQKQDGRNWELALMAQGDILIKADSNYVLPGIKEGVGSWKRLLSLAAGNEAQGIVLKQLWDRLADPHDVQVMLKNIIDAQQDLEDWRRAIIDTPEIYDYCGQRMIRWHWNGGIYPLRKTRMTGLHAELFTYCLDTELKKSNELNILQPTSYSETSMTDEEPEMGLIAVLDDIEYSFWARWTNEEELYQLWLYEPKAPEKLMAKFLKDEGFTQREGHWAKVVKRSQLKPAILELDAALARSGTTKRV